MADVLAALKQLDATKDEQWGPDGLPRLDTVKQLAGDATLTREAIDAAAPGFNRTNAATYTVPPAAPPAPPAPPVAEAQAPAPPPAAPTAEQPASPPTAPVSEAAAAPSGDGAAAAPSPTADSPGSEAGQTEQGEVAGDKVDRTDEIAQLEAELAEAREAEDSARRSLDSVKSDFEAKQRNTDRIQGKLDAIRPPETPVDLILAAQRATLATLEERGRRKTLLHESGINLKELAKGLKSPLDQAMARKSGFGLNRPGA